MLLLYIFKQIIKESYFMFLLVYFITLAKMWVGPYSGFHNVSARKTTSDYDFRTITQNVDMRLETGMREELLCYTKL
jgi:hypothetical protein